jgi:uncharacterized protein (TIGR00369 family)
MTETPPALSDADLLARFQNSRNQPPGSETLGFRMIRVVQAEMLVEVLFTARPEFCNPMRQIQGGFLCAMLDDTMSVAGLVASGMTCVMPTLEMKTSFLRPAKPGQLRCIGRVLKWGRSIAFTEGELFDEAGVLLAKATATAKPTPFEQFKAPRTA